MGLNRYYARTCDVCGYEVPTAASSAGEAMKEARRAGVRRYVYRYKTRERDRWGDGHEVQTYHVPIRGDVCRSCSKTHPPIDVPPSSPWTKAPAEVSS